MSNISAAIAINFFLQALNCLYAAKEDIKKMPAISVPYVDAEADRLMKLNSIYKAKSSSGDSSALL